MYQKQRVDSIVEILKKHGFVTVKFLCDELHYSTATINRDLNYMQTQKLIKRSYGGVELIKRKYVPLVFRYNKMRPAKNKIGRVAAKYINDGDTVFLDGSTTTQYMSKYITEKKNLTVITNNMALATFLGDYDINVICLGGKMVEKPCILNGEITIENARKYTADKFFFSTGGVTEDGKIFSSGFGYLLHKTNAENSKEIFFLADHDKIMEQSKNTSVLFTLGDVDYVITDYIFSDKVKNEYPDTQFVEVE